jgi:hypothetical protein
LEGFPLGPNYTQTCDRFIFDPFKERAPSRLAQRKQSFFLSGRNMEVEGSCHSLDWGIRGRVGMALPSSDERVSKLLLGVTESQIFVSPSKDLCHVSNPMSKTTCFLVLFSFHVPWLVT